MLRASVIIPTYNRGWIIGDCVRALASQDLPADEYEIIVVNDGSTDSTADILKELQKELSNLIVINQQNKGPAAARNAGLKVAKGDVVIFVDSDVVVCPGFLKDHLRFHEKNKNLIVQGFVLRVPDKSFVDCSRWRFKLSSYTGAVFVTENVSVRREHIVEIGGFDENFGRRMGWQDLDVGLRLIQKGLKVKRVFRKCRAFHVNPPAKSSSIKEFMQKKQFQRGVSARYFRQKYKDAPFRIRLEVELLTKPWRAALWSYLTLAFLWAEREEVFDFVERLYRIPVLKSVLAPFVRKILFYHYYWKGYTSS